MSSRMTTLERRLNNPIIEASDLTGDNVNYPAVIKVLDWVDDRLDEYYMYFSHKRGQYIRLAYVERSTAHRRSIHLERSRIRHAVHWSHPLT